jgi:hypothetical protein
VQGGALGLEQVCGAQPLVAVLAAAYVVDVVSSPVQRLAESAAAQPELDVTPGAAALEHEQVAPIGVDVHQVRVQRAHTQRPSPGVARHALGAGSSVAHRHELRASPRATSSSRRASIAV